MEEKKILEQYRGLTKYDKAPQGTLCRVIRDNDEVSLYIQVSPKTEEPEWITVGHLLHDVFASSLEDASFIKMCVNRYVAQKGGDVNMAE